MKLRLSKRFIRFLYKFIDVEASGDVAKPDERMIEYSYALSRILSDGIISAKVLDCGCVAKINPVPATLCELGYKVWGIDSRDFRYEHSNFQYIKGDIRRTDFPDGFFDFVCAISTIEHIGISGRYNISDIDITGDILAVREMVRITKDSGKLIFTVPFGNSNRERMGKVFERVYDLLDIDRLFSDVNIIEKVLYNGGLYNIACLQVVKR